MTFLIVVAAAVLVVVALHLGYGWFFSNGLHREALKVGERVIDKGVWVREVSRDRIELESQLPRQDIGHPGTFGINWSDGHGRVGDVVGAGGGKITRQFQPISGVPPVCTGVLTECEPVELDPYVFRQDPGDVGLAFSEARYESLLGPMGAWLVPARKQSDRWAVHCHGWRAEKRELIRFLPSFHGEGFTSLVIDYRNDPGTPRDPSGRYRFGLSEWEDLECAVAYALEQGAREVVLTGCSTGAALVMAFLERSKLAPHVDAIVLDSPNIVLVDTFRQGIRDVNSTQLMKEVGLWITDLRWKVDWEATNYVQRASETLRVPALVFHGTSDQTVPITTSRQLEAAVPGLVELIETTAAGHVLSWNVDPQRYAGYLTRFLERI